MTAAASGIRHVYCLTPDREAPTGGMKTLYRHVDILNAHGQSAFVVHARDGFRCRWFSNQTRVTWAPRLELGPDDVLVVPEIFQHAFQPRAPRTGRRAALRRLFRPEEMPWAPTHRLVEQARRIVLLSLNPYNTFAGCGVDRLWEVVPYHHERVAAVLTISRDAEQYLRHAFPRLPVVRFTKAVDPERFRPAPAREPLVCFMPRKKREEVVQVLGILRARDALRGFRAVPIEGLSEEQVIDVMARAAVFLSFSHAEGLPRPPMEAMLCGALVVGYHGRGGREYFDPAHCFPVEEGDVAAFARAAEEVLGRLRQDLDAFADCTRKARAFVLEHYAPAAEEREVTAFWRRLAAGEPLAPTPAAAP